MHCYKSDYVTVKKRGYAHSLFNKDQLYSVDKPLDQYYGCKIGDFVYSNIQNPGVIVDIVIGDVHKPGVPVVPDLVLCEVMFDENKPIKYYDARWVKSDWMSRFERMRIKVQKYEEKIKSLSKLMSKYAL